MLSKFSDALVEICLRNFSSFNLIRCSESHTILRVQMNLVVTFYTFRPLWIKFDSDLAAPSLLSDCKFRENRCKKKPTFCEKPLHIMLLKISSFLKIGSLKAVSFLWGYIKLHFTHVPLNCKTFLN